MIEAMIPIYKPLRESHKTMKHLRRSMQTISNKHPWRNAKSLVRNTSKRI